MRTELMEELVSAYIKYWLLPRMEDITHPGFVLTKFSEKGADISVRDVFLPEDLFIGIEDSLVNKYGKEGIRALYSVGKKSGYAYASLANLMKCSEVTEAGLREFRGPLQLISETPASDISVNSIDLSKKKIEVALRNYLVCRKNGRGHLILEGGIGGIWAYMVDDKTVEGLQTRCQGRGNEECVLVAQPYDLFQTHPEYRTDSHLLDLRYSEEYASFNAVRETEYCRYSLETLLAENFFEYSGGEVLYKGIRHLELDPHLLYFLEEECGKLSGCLELLFNVAFDVGARIIYAAEDKSPDIIMNYLSALGWGDMLLIYTKKTAEFISFFHPWTQYSEASDYVIFRGLVSGMVSQQLNKHIEFDKINVDCTNQLTIYSKTSK